jgi:ketosteroid isomerase-like protein
MSEENVELARHAYEAFNRGDLEGTVADFAPAFEYVPSGAIPDSGRVYRGAEGWKELWPGCSTSSTTPTLKSTS